MRKYVFSENTLLKCILVEDLKGRQEVTDLNNMAVKAFVKKITCNIYYEISLNSCLFCFHMF